MSTYKHLVPEFLAAMYDIGRYGAEKYGEGSFYGMYCGGLRRRDGCLGGQQIADHAHALRVAGQLVAAADVRLDAASVSEARGFARSCTPPCGASGHRALLPRAVTEAALPTLLGMCAERAGT